MENHTQSQKRIVILGATSGIGFESARRLASRGWRVGAAGRNAEALRNLQREFPDNVEWERIDITAPDAPALLERLIGKLGGMDTYFHVAGIGYSSTSLSPEAELATVETNVAGFTRMIDAAFLYFAKQNGGRGHIAAITSVAGTKGIGDLAAYSASKRFQQTYLTALNQLSRSKGMKIKFSDMRPGWVKTPLLRQDGKYNLEMSVPYATRRILNALSRKKRVSVIDWRWAIVVALMRLVPNALWVRLPIHTGELPGK